jgi:hypothetical protein
MGWEELGLYSGCTKRRGKEAGRAGAAKPGGAGRGTEIIKI